MVILTSVFRAINDKLFQESFETTFIENIKSCKKTLIFFLYKKFLKIVLKLIFLRYLLTFPYYYCYKHDYVG